MEYLQPTTWTFLLACFLLIPAMSWLERQRGTSKEFEKIPKFVALLGLGYLCAFYTGHWMDWQALVIMLSVRVVHRMGLGEPTGHALTGVGGQVAEDGSIYESWQVTKLLKENPWVALATRGIMVGLGTLLALDWVASLKIVLAFGVAFPLAAYIVRYKLELGGEGWGRMEEIRGTIIGIVLLLSAVITMLLGK